MATAAKELKGAVADATALEIFQNQWEVYQKFLKHDYLSNGEACRELNRFLTGAVARPFNFLDLACGDASGIVGALQTTPIGSYRGVDLSSAALGIAERNLTRLSCPVELEEADFTTALRGRPRGDIVWVSLSLHHLDTDAKLAFMREVRAGLEPHGAFLVYEPTRREGEDRAQYLDRMEAIGRRAWTELTASQFDEAMKHVRGCDVPETVSGWHELGQEAGFSAVSELYNSPTDLFRLFLYRP